MRKLSLLMCLFTALIYGCADQSKTTNQTNRFESFEISYTDGWIKRFSFLVDSSKTYLAPTRWDSAYSGTLPDTIFALLDSTYRRILCDSSIKSIDPDCYDCSVVAIQIVIQNDTIRIYQEGDISKEFRPIIKSLQTFLDSGSHQKIKSDIFLETRSMTMPPPPPPPPPPTIKHDS